MSCLFGNFTRKKNFNLDEYLQEFFFSPFQIELDSRKLLNPHIKEHHPENNQEHHPMVLQTGFSYPQRSEIKEYGNQ